jgi:hypothetical protein
MKTKEEEFIESIKDFDLNNLEIRLLIEKFFKYSYLKIYWFVVGLIIMGIPMICYYDRVLKHPLWFGFLFVSLHYISYKLAVRNEVEMDLDYKQSCISIKIINNLIKLKKDEQSKSTSKNN